MRGIQCWIVYVVFLHFSIEFVLQLLFCCLSESHLEDEHDLETLTLFEPIMIKRYCKKCIPSLNVFFFPFGTRKVLEKGKK